MDRPQMSEMFLFLQRHIGTDPVDGYEYGADFICVKYEKQSVPFGEQTVFVLCGGCGRKLLLAVLGRLCYNKMNYADNRDSLSVFKKYRSILGCVSYVI